MDTIKQQRRKDKIKEIIEKGDVAFIKYLFEIEEYLDEIKESVKPINASLMENVERVSESVLANIKLNNKGDDGKDGEDYVITDDDKKEIAEMVEVPVEEIAKKASKLIKVPVVEKVIEKTEVIKEVPIVTNEIKEVAVPNTPEQTRDQLESLPDGEKLSIQAIQDLKEELEAIRKLVGTRTVGGGLSSMALQSKFIDDETPNGLVDSSNTVFTLANSPIPSSVKVYVGGSRQRVGEDYTLSGRTITFTLAPTSTDVILVDYRIV